MIFFDRIKETSTSTGTGTFTLSGAAVGYKAFTNGTYKYCIVNSTETEWEVGEGTVASGVLTRTTIEASSNAGSAVNFSAGTKYVFNTVSAAYVNNLVPYTGATSNLNLGNFNVYANAYFNGFSSVTASGTQIVLTISSPPVTLVSGSGGQTIKLPDATTLPKGTIFSFNNNQTTGVINVNNNSNTLVKTVQSGAYLTLELIDNSNAAGTWDAHFQTPSNVSWSTNTFDYTGSITSATWNGAVVQPNRGGTGQSTFTDGQLLIGNSSGNTLTKATLTAGLGISISNGNGSISISSSFASLTTTGSSGAATLVSGVLNIPTYTLAGLGGASDSLAMHLAGTETATGFKTFSIGLQTTTGDNFLNYTSGNTLIGHSATPGVNTFKLNVLGTAKISGALTANSFALPTNQTISGSGSGNWTFTNSGGGGWYIEWIQNGATAMTLSTENSLLLGTTTSVSSSILTLVSTAKGVLLPRMTTAQKNAIATPATSLLLYDTDLAAFQYYSGSAWTSLGGGGGISGSGTAGQVTYWSGSNAVTGSSNLFWDNTNGRLGIGTSSPLYILHIIKNQNANTALNITNTSNGVSANPSFSLTSDTLSGEIAFVKKSSGSGTYKLTLPSDAYFINTTAGHLVLLNDFSTGNIKLAAGGASTAQATLFSTGNFAVGNTTDNNYRLDINGTGATAGALRVTGGLSLFQGGKMTIAAATTSYASLNIPSGTAPTSPANGDIWQDGTDIKIRIGGTTKTFTLI